MSNYVMFLDESGDHNLVKYDEQFPVFTLAGCIFEETYYFETVVPRINNIKEKFFGNTSVVLRSYDIRKANPPFSILLNKNIRENFISEMNDTISNLEFTIIASCIHKSRLTNTYIDPADPYDLAFSFVIERYVKYLEENAGTGYFSIESRDPKSNKDVLDVYDQHRLLGSAYCSTKEFNERIGKLEFIEKARNINGHQLADLVAYPTGRFCMDKRKSNPAFDVIKPKFRRRGSRARGYGYKEFP